MAMTVVGRGTGVISAINVTPMADVMIVLLIVFMIATPLLVTDVDLPQAAHGRPGAGTELMVTMSRNGQVHLGKKLMTLRAIGPALRESLDRLPEDERLVSLKADAALAYSDVKSLMNLCRRAGAKQVALMTKPESDRP